VTRGRLEALRIGAVLAILPLAVFVPVLAGLLAIAVLLLRWAPAVEEVLIAVRPLVLPIAMVMLLGAPSLSTLQQIFIGVALGLLLVPWAASDWARSGAVVERTVQSLFKGVMALALALVIAVAVFVVLYLVPATRDWVGGSIETMDRFGGVSIGLALIAVGLWVVAIALRAGGFMSSIGRIVVAVVLLAGVVRGLMALKLLPLESTFAWLPTAWLFAAGGVLLILLLAVELLARAPVGAVSGWLRPLRGGAVWATTKGGLSQRVRTRAWARGVGWAIASSLVLFGAIAYGWVEVRSASSDVTGGEGRRGGEQPSKPPSQMSDAELREAFVPILVFSKHQRWLPENADAYVRDARLLPRPPRGAQLRGGLPATCPEGTPDPCYRLLCGSAQAGCAHTRDLSNRSGRHDDGAVYARVARRDGAARDRAAFDERIGPFGDRLTILVQYWIFYAYDEWIAPVVGGRVVQRHAGDWEAVTVGLSDAEPLFVAYSQHCGGRWARWARVRVADRPAPRTHPLVAVAAGSHANYERAEDVRSPDWTSCNGVPGEAVELLSYVWNIRDRTAGDWELLPREIVPIDATQPPMTFPGTWGGDDRAEFVGFGAKELDTGAGPRTPTRQPLWRQTTRQIFCGRAWRGPARPRCPR
jgi:hypothetical protein